MLRELRHKLKKLFQSQTAIGEAACVPVIEANPPFLFEATLSVEARKREAVAADEALRIFRTQHTWDVGPEYDALFTASRDAMYRLEEALADYNAARKAGGLTSPRLREGAKHHV
jgi:hypothetical protein